MVRGDGPFSGSFHQSSVHFIIERNPRLDTFKKEIQLKIRCSERRCARLSYPSCSVTLTLTLQTEKSKEIFFPGVFVAQVDAMQKRVFPFHCRRAVEPTMIMLSGSFDPNRVMQFGARRTCLRVHFNCRCSE